jgi:hypothetical protein
MQDTPILPSDNLYSQTCPCGHLYLAVSCIERPTFTVSTSTEYHQIRTTFVSVIFRPFGGCFGIFDIVGLTQSDWSSGFLHQLNWAKRYNANIVESAVKHHQANKHIDVYNRL